MTPNESPTIGSGRRIRELINPRAISMAYDPEGRAELARKIWGARSEMTETLEDDAKGDPGIKHPNLRKMLDAYYERISHTPLSNEEKREMLTPEALAELTTEEYIALWRRLNPHFLTHVTRHGFRDHFGHLGHTEGIGRFHDGFTSIMQDEGKLRPPLAINHGLKNRDEESVRAFLEKYVLEAKDMNSAADRLYEELHDSNAAASKYADETAVHFAAQMVSNQNYGAEKGNEIFVVYPADVLASQHDFAFNSGQKSFIDATDDATWNDVFVWPSSTENAGISVNAGLVFLPKNTLVDPKTGSKYASEMQNVDGEMKRVMIEDRGQMEKFVNWAKSLTDESPVITAYNEYDKSLSNDQNKHTCVSQIRQEMLEIGFDEGAATDIATQLMKRGGLSEFKQSGNIGFGSNKSEVALDQLRKANAHWKRPEKLITAEAYWESYFQEHPDQKPRHIVYYDGDPTAAVEQFKVTNNIGRADISGKTGPLLGFEDRHISDKRNNSRANPGYDKLVRMASEIIKKHYKED